jgi:hypothetical protein
VPMPALVYVSWIVLPGGKFSALFIQGVAAYKQLFEWK